MKNKIFISIIALFILIVFGGLIMSNFPSSDELGQKLFLYGISIGGFVGLIMLLLNGSFIRTRYFRFALGFLGLVLVGALFLLLGWVLYGRVMIFLGMISVIIIYSASFLKKPAKRRLDYLKLIWVILNYTIPLLSILNFVKGSYTIISSYFLWLIILDFIITGFKNRTLFVAK